MEKNFKIMIVDDEEKTRQLIKLCVDWKKIGCEIIGEAEGGQEALDMMEELPVDLVLADIEMTYMNGLELSKNIRKRYPTVKIVILTAHENFYYAKESIEIGICDYIVKPIKREQLKNSILKIKEQLGKEQEKKEEIEKVKIEYERYKIEIDSNRKNLKNFFINDAIYGEKNINFIKEKSKFYEIDFDFESMEKRVAVITFIENEETAEIRNLVMYIELEKIINNCLQDKNKHLLFTDYYGRSALLLNESKDEIYKGLYKLSEILLQKRLKFCIGVGKSVTDWKDVKTSYENALEAIRHKIIYGDNSIIYYEQLVLGEINNKNNLENRLDDICFYVKIGDLDKTLQEIESLFQQYIGIGSVTNARFDTFNCVIQLMNVIHELGFETNNFFQTGEISLKHIVDIDNIPMLKNYLINLVSYMIHTIQNKRNSLDKNIIVQIKGYLEENYQDSSISLIAIAEKFYINQSYLSRIFKQESGINFVSYLTKIRVERAIELLNKGDYKIYEIAEAVGIPDANYFPKCFKKITGLSISEYKKRGQ